MTRSRLLLAAAVALTTAFAVSPALPAAADTTPTVTGVSPSQGPTGGGTTVTITGTGFASDSQVLFGQGAANSQMFVTATQLTAVSPQRSAGTVDVRVCAHACAGPNDGSTTSTADQFTFVGAPTVSYLTPRTGPTTGGTTVTVTGTNYTSDSTVTFDGISATVVSPSSDSTSITVTSPAHAAGDVHVQVSTAGGISPQANNGTDGFTYAAAPTVTGVSPASGLIAGGTQVAITGTGFNPGAASVSVSFGGTPGTGTFVSSPTTLYTNVPAHARGPVDVLVSAAGGTSSPSAADVYSYLDPPVVTSVSPDTGLYTGGTTVTVTGSSFTPDARVSFAGTPAASVSVVSRTQLTAVTGFHTLVSVEDKGSVVVTTADGSSDGPLSQPARSDTLGPDDGSTPGSDRSFTYTQPINTPVVTGVSPSSGPTTGGELVTVTGRYFIGINVDPTYMSVIVQPVGHPNDGVNLFHKDLTGVSAGKFTIRMPRADAAGPVDILVVGPQAGCTCNIRTSAPSSTDHFTYEPTVSLTGKQSKVTVSHTQKAKVAFTLKGASSGKVTVKNGSRTLTSGTLKSGKITLTLPKLAKGSYTLKVTYVRGGKTVTTTVKLTVT